MDEGKVDRPAERMLTVSEVCERLNLSPPTVYRMMDRGELAYAQFGRTRRIKPEDLAAAVAAAMRGGKAVGEGK